MKRYPHYWWPLKGHRYPSRIAVLDCDSLPCGDATAGRAQIEQLSRWSLALTRIRRDTIASDGLWRGQDTAGLWRVLSALLGRSGRLWLFCPLACRVLPLIGFWERLEGGRITLDGRDRRDESGAGAIATSASAGICIVEDPPTVILCRVVGRPGKLLILDVRNWGIEVDDKEKDCDRRTRTYGEGIRQCVSTLRRNGQGSLRCTAASQSVSALRSAYDVVRLHCHTDPGAAALERGALYGGRCECYRLGELRGPIYHVDVRSMYPSICLTLPIPVSLRRYHGDGESIERASRESPGATLADVTIRCADPVYPLRRGTDTVYPVGRYRTTLCGPELTHAAETGAITRWHSGAEYTCAPYLSAMYERWTAMLADARTQGRVQELSWIKRVMNCLPGKFAEPGRQWVPMPYRPDRDEYDTWHEPDGKGGFCRWRNMAGYTTREEISGESYWSIPAIAAWVTAAGRSRMWLYREAAGRENVWYTDTDSLLCNRDGFDRLLRGGFIRDGETGHLRLLGRHRTGFVYGIRHYQLDNTIVCAGVPRGSIRAGETREDYWVRQRMADEIALGRRPDGRERQGRYPTAIAYHHGVVHDDGRVTPLEIWQDD